MKSQIGYTIGATGALTLIATLLMMKYHFMAPSMNLDHLDESCDYPNIVITYKEIAFDTFLTNNFAFGGSNASLVVRKYHQ